MGKNKNSWIESLLELLINYSPDLDGVDSVRLETVERGLADGAVDLLLASVVPAGGPVGFVEDGVARDGGLVVSRGHPGQVGRPAGVVQHHQLGDLVRHVLANNIKSVKETKHKLYVCLVRVFRERCFCCENINGLIFSLELFNVGSSK